MHCQRLLKDFYAHMQVSCRHPNRSIHALGPSLSRTLPLHLITHTLFISLSLSLSLSIPPAHTPTHSLHHSLTHSLTASLTHSSTHSLIHSLTHCITHSLHHSLTRSLHHALTQSLHHSFTHCITHPITASLSHSLIPPVMHCQRLLKTSMPICKFQNTTAHARTLELYYFIAFVKPTTRSWRPCSTPQILIVHRPHITPMHACIYTSCKGNCKRKRQTSIYTAREQSQNRCPKIYVKT